MIRPEWYGDGVCSIDGCGRTVHRRRLCRPHYNAAPRVISVRLRPPKPLCSIDGCEVVALRRGMCNSHDYRARRYGDPLAVIGFMNADPVDRFWAKVDKAGPISPHRPDLGPCWLWTGALKKGYGHFCSQARRDRPRTWIGAHRWAYEAMVGPIPADLELDHLCRNPPCVNPGHLEPVTSAENLRRARAANRIGASA